MTSQVEVIVPRFHDLWLSIAHLWFLAWGWSWSYSKLLFFTDWENETLTHPLSIKCKPGYIPGQSKARNQHSCCETSDKTEESGRLKSSKSPRLGVESFVGGLIISVPHPDSSSLAFFPSGDFTHAHTHTNSCMHMWCCWPKKTNQKSLGARPARPKRWGHPTEPHFPSNCTSDQRSVSCNNYTDPKSSLANSSEEENKRTKTTWFVSSKMFCVRRFAAFDPLSLSGVMSRGFFSTSPSD